MEQLNVRIIPNKILYYIGNHPFLVIDNFIYLINTIWLYNVQISE